MKKFEIRDIGENRWLVSHNEQPKFRWPLKIKNEEKTGPSKGLPIQRAIPGKCSCYRKCSNGCGGTTPRKPMGKFRTNALI